MDLEEAKIKSRISEEEENAVKRYINFGHTQMNSLASFDILKYLESSDKGWYLLGAQSSVPGEKEKTEEELGNEILRSIEDFSNVYSVMLKYSNGIKQPQYLYRGTSNTEIHNLSSGDTYNKIISTTTDSFVAKRFVEYGNASLLRIKTSGDIPFLDIDEFIGNENIDREENEIILAPYSSIKRIDYNGKDNEYTYYNLELDKPQLYEFKEGEKEEFRDIIKSDFAKIMDIGKKYKTLIEQDEIDFYRLQNSHNSEDINFLRQKRDENFQNRKELKSELDKFSSVIRNYIQGICLEKQKEFEEAEKIVDEYNNKLMAEERAKIIEQQQKEAVLNYNSKISSTNDNFSRALSSLETNKNELILNSGKFSEICTVLGIPFNSEIDTLKMQEDLARIQDNTIKIAKELESRIIIDETKSDLDENSFEEINNVHLASEDAIEISQRIIGSVEKYDKKAVADIKDGIDKKVQEIIRMAKIEKLKEQKEVVEGRKISFFGKLRGQEKLKEIELENIDLQIKYERTKPHIEKKSYSIHDSLSDMFAFSNSELDGELTPPMKDFYSKIKIYFGINENTIKKMISQKSKEKPALIEDNAISTKTKISNLEQENNCLKQDIQDNIYLISSEDNIAQYNSNKSLGFIEYMEGLNKISQITEFRNYFKEKVPQKENIESEKENADDAIK